MQDHDLGFEVSDAFRLHRFIEQNHTFAESCALQLLLLETLNGEAHGLPSVSNLDRQAFVMDTLNLHRLEHPRFVGAKV